MKAWWLWERWSGRSSIRWIGTAQMEESGQMELGVGMFVLMMNGVGKERNEMRQDGWK